PHPTSEPVHRTSAMKSVPFRNACNILDISFLFGTKCRASSAITIGGKRLFPLVVEFVWFGAVCRKKIAEPLGIHSERLVTQYKRTGVPMFREILDLEHGNAKTKHGEEPRKADATGIDAKARGKYAPEMRQGHGEEPPFQEVLEAIEAAKGDPPFQ